MRIRNLILMHNLIKIFLVTYFKIVWFIGGTLIFDEADIELQAENILITDGGILQVYEENLIHIHC